MDVEEFKQKYEELKNNPMYQKYCSVLETKDKIIKKVKQENEHLKEQVAYLRRSVERKENRIIELEDERIPYTNEYVKKLEKQNQELKKQLSNSHQIKSQQKEFIEWLEQKLKKYTPNLRVNEFDEYDNRIAQYINAEVYEIPPEDVVKEVLSKYKEIIRGKE